MSDILNIDNFTIDKSSWKLVKFGDVVFEPKENCKDVVAEGIEHVVGLEHIDSEDIHLRRSASIDEDTTFTKKFAEDDVLFGRRRAYLKKAAKAKFKGICSGDITVMRTRDELMPELLPFIINNDKFFDYAVTHSAGGLSPRVKFRDLANYEFMLPPKEEQQELDTILWAMDNVVQRQVDLLNQNLFVQRCFFKESIFEDTTEMTPFGHLLPKYPIVKLDEVVIRIQYGISESLDEVGAVPILRMNNLGGGKLLLDDLKYYSPAPNELDKFMLEKGDILFNRTNSFELVGKTSLFKAEENFSFASYLIRINTDAERLLPEFLNFYMNSKIGQSKIRKYRTPGVSQSNINAQSLRNLILPLPDISIQQHIVDQLEALQSAADKIEGALKAGESLQKSLIQQIF